MWLDLLYCAVYVRKFIVHVNLPPKVLILEEIVNYQVNKVSQPGDIVQLVPQVLT